MNTRPRHGHAESAAADVPELGLVRPPLVYLASIVIGLLIQLVMPFRFLPRTLSFPLGALQLGIALWVNSVWLVGTLVGAVAIIHFVVIRKEEQYLERRFGAEYLAYKASVRRWL